VDLPDTDDINIDRHFHGFTQLYSTPDGQSITVDIIAITGLDGHAFGSWQGKGNLGRMWVLDFFLKDLPPCRTMIYGYNSKCCGVVLGQGVGLALGTTFSRLSTTQPFFFFLHPWYLR
jgi:hypothetical protein